jgi:hypothetical protein
MVVMVAMVALWDEAILGLEELISIKGIAVVETTLAKAAKTTAAKLTAVKTAAKLTAEAAEATVASYCTVAFWNPIETTAYTCIHC